MSIVAYVTPADFMSKFLAASVVLELIIPSAAIFPEASILVFVTPAVFIFKLVPDNVALELIPPSAATLPEASIDAL